MIPLRDLVDIVRRIRFTSPVSSFDFQKHGTTSVIHSKAGYSCPRKFMWEQALRGDSILA